ncbi:MAG: flavodoxin [Gammaproteobacteria bacterium]|nr:MAG: flavodoxin [Gammaproteobacteria bacterium]
MSHSPKKTLLLVYHSQSGASAQLASAVWRGAQRETEVETRMLRAVDASTRDLANCQGLVFVGAENSGTLAGGLKDFLDRSLYPAIDRALVLPAAVVISAGNDGRGAAAQISRILKGYPFPLVQEPLILRGEPDGDSFEQCKALGEAIATGLAMGMF